jgi:hypothetical protein
MTMPFRTELLQTEFLIDILNQAFLFVLIQASIFHILEAPLGKENHPYEVAAAARRQ